MNRHGGEDWKAIKQRVATGQATQDDAAFLLAESERLRARTHESAADSERKYWRLWRQVRDFEFTLRMAQEAIDPCGRGLHFSQVDLFKCILQPERLQVTRERIATDYLDSLRWRAKHEADCAKRQAEVLEAKP